MIGTHVIFVTLNSSDVITERKGYIRDKIRVMDTYHLNTNQLVAASVDVYVIEESTGEIHRVSPRYIKSVVKVGQGEAG